MPPYRVYLLGANQKASHFVTIECENDEEAVRTVAMHQHGHAMELWEEARLVKIFPGQPES